MMLFLVRESSLVRCGGIWPRSFGEKKDEELSLKGSFPERFWIYSIYLHNTTLSKQQWHIENQTFLVEGICITKQFMNPPFTMRIYEMRVVPNHIPACQFGGCHSTYAAPGAWCEAQALSR